MSDDRRDARLDEAQLEVVLDLIEEVVVAYEEDQILFGRHPDSRMSAVMERLEDALDVLFGQEPPS